MIHRTAINRITLTRTPRPTGRPELTVGLNTAGDSDRVGNTCYALKISEDFSVKLAKVESLSKIGAAVLVPIVLIIIGNSFKHVSNERSLEARFVEKAISMLSVAPSKESVPLREWAVEVVNKYSEVKLPESTQELLITGLAFDGKSPFKTAEIVPIEYEPSRSGEIVEVMIFGTGPKGIVIAKYYDIEEPENKRFAPLRTRLGTLEELRGRQFRFEAWTKLAAHEQNGVLFVILVGSRTIYFELGGYSFEDSSSVYTVDVSVSEPVSE